MVKLKVSPNSYWSSLIVEELIRLGCDYFCISPGSRSTPLTIAVAKNKKSVTKIFYDERGAAYHALGYGKARGKPAILICTSGTATANYYPAIIEAKQDSIPLIVLTADRPPELRATGANQTIDQVKMFGDYVNWFFELPTPDLDIPPQFVLTTVDQVVFKSMHLSKGPVHINCMFREPFFPDAEIFLNEILQKWQNSDKPFAIYRNPKIQLQPDLEISSQINSSKRGIIIAGKMESLIDSQAVLKFARQLNWPVFADITSGLRMMESELIIEYFDLALLSDSFLDILNPEIVIQFGKRFVSKRMLNYLNEINLFKYFLIDESPDRFDPNHKISDRIVGNISQFCESLIPQIESQIDHSWIENIQSMNSKISNLLDKEFAKNSLSEIVTLGIISKYIPENSGLYLASSMPIRDMDMFAVTRQSKIMIAANRGASGIDGTIASAIGFAEGIKSSVTLVIGDLAFIHDLNSLHQLASSNYPVFIVVLNNSGGGIFSFLPIANQKEVFERYFATPHQLTFENAAKMFDLNYFNPKTNPEFINNYQEVVKNNQSAIIEITTDREENHKLHQNFYSKVINLLEN